jgi:hypothetical protein
MRIELDQLIQQGLNYTLDNIFKIIYLLKYCLTFQYSARINYSHIINVNEIFRHLKIYIY